MVDGYGSLDEEALLQALEGEALKLPVRPTTPTPEEPSPEEEEGEEEWVAENSIFGQRIKEADSKALYNSPKVPTL